MLLIVMVRVIDLRGSKAVVTAVLLVLRGSLCVDVCRLVRAARTSFWLSLDPASRMAS